MVSLSISFLVFSIVWGIVVYRKDIIRFLTRD